MANLVKFKEIIDWGEGCPTKYGPAYIDIDKIQYICPHADGDPNHCTVTLHGRWAVGLDISADKLAEMINKTDNRVCQNYTKTRVALWAETLTALDLKAALCSVGCGSCPVRYKDALFCADVKDIYNFMHNEV